MADVEPANLHEQLSSISEERKEYKTYKRSYIGLVQLMLLNVVVSWNWITFGSIPEQSARYFNADSSAITWFSTASLFAFLVSCPFMMWALNHHGPKYSILVGSAIILVGSWIRYAAVQISTGRYAVAMTGQIIIGLAQPFVLAVSTRYSKLWYTDKGQIAANAAISLSNPLGAAIGELVAPAVAITQHGIPLLLLVVAIISTVATVPAPFIPKEPPSPPSATATMERIPFGAAIWELVRNKVFFALLFAFSVYVGLFNSSSTLFGQILIPYGYGLNVPSLCGAIQIFGGIGISAIVSPILDRTRAYKIALSIVVPILAACYVILIFIPSWGSVGGAYALVVVMGGAAFSLLPLVLELLASMTQPVSPEVSNILAWAGGQGLGGVLIISMNAMVADRGWDDQPPGSMMRGLILEAGLAVAAVPSAFYVIFNLRNKR